MLSIKVVLIALAVVCATQAYAVDYDVSSIETYAASGFFDEIAAVLEKVRERVKDLDKELKDAIDVAYEKVQTSANKQAELWYLAIQKAVDQANKYGVDVSDCVSENHALKDIVNNVLVKTRQCIAEERPIVQEVQKKLDALLVEQQDIMDVAKEAVKKCDGLPLVQEIRCNIDALAPMAKDAAQVLINTGIVAGEVAIISAKSANDIRVCVKGVFESEGQAAKQIVDKATQCIGNRIQGNYQFALY